jgi:histidine triad (HIT) family protein
MAMMADNIFQKIIDKQIPAKVAYEDDCCLAFHDIKAVAPVHVLIIPKKVIRTHADVSDADTELLGHLHVVAARLAKQLGLTDGYRLVINCDESAGQTVPHLHLHRVDPEAVPEQPGVHPVWRPDLALTHP